MTKSEKISCVKLMLDNDAEATNDVISGYLTIAEELCMNQLYPFGYTDDDDFPDKYHRIECQLASRLYSRRGGLGEVSHNENGINRTWANADDKDLLGLIVPMAKL